MPLGKSVFFSSEGNPLSGSIYNIVNDFEYPSSEFWAHLTNIHSVNMDRVPTGCQAHSGLWDACGRSAGGADRQAGHVGLDAGAGVPRALVWVPGAVSWLVTPLL